MADPRENSFSDESAGGKHWNLGGDVCVPPQNKALVFCGGNAGNFAAAGGSVVLSAERFGDRVTEKDYFHQSVEGLVHRIKRRRDGKYEKEN